MPDPRTTRLAHLIADYCVGLKPNDQVFIQAQPDAAPLIQEIYKVGVERGAHITPVIDIPGLRSIFLANGIGRTTAVRLAGRQNAGRDLRRAHLDLCPVEHARAVGD